MDNLALRFVTESGVGSLSTATFIVAMVIFVAATIILKIWEHGIKGEAGLAPRTFYAPDVAESPHANGIHRDHRAIQNLFVPITYRAEPETLRHRGGYLRSLTLSRMTMVCSDDRVAKGHILEFDLGSVQKVLGTPTVPSVSGQVVGKKKLDGSPDSWLLDVKLLSLPYAAEGPETRDG